MLLRKLFYKRSLAAYSLQLKKLLQNLELSYRLRRKREI